MQTQVINISLPEPLLKLADLMAEEELRTRSEFFREAIRSYILKETRLKAIFSYAKRQAKKTKIKPADLEKITDEYRQG